MSGAKARWKATQAKVRTRWRAWRVAAQNRAAASTCFYCGVPFDIAGPDHRTVDHRTPKSRGGSDGLANLVFACYACNQRKRDRSEEDFLASEWLIERRARVASRPPDVERGEADGGTSTLSGRSGGIRGTRTRLASTSTEQDPAMTEQNLSALAERHLWGHFTTLKSGVEETRVIDHGDACYVWDHHGKRYLDGLAGLFVSQVGHGRAELARAAAEQAEKLAYFPIWTYAHPSAVRLAARLAELAPGDLNRVFFTTGGSEAVESAWKLARQYFRAVGQPGRHKVISRHLAYHGTTLGALSITGIAALRTPFEPLVPGARKVSNTNRYRCRLCAHSDACTLGCADDIEAMILREGPESVAAVFLEPVQNAGGCFVPPEGYLAHVREICDRYGVLLISDEVICAYGRLGEWFGAQRYGYQPDMILSAKGLTSGYSPLGAMIVSDRLAEPFVGTGQTFLHGLTFAGHPVSCAVALANLDIFESEQLLDKVRTNEPLFRESLDDLSDLPIVGDIRGAGYFYGIELVKDRDTRETFTSEERDHLLRGFLSNRLLDLGLICRVDDRGEPVVQLSPPLIAGPDQFEEINQILRQALTEAMAEMRLR